jgi:hypothetical protein
MNASDKGGVILQRHLASLSIGDYTAVWITSGLPTARSEELRGPHQPLFGNADSCASLAS